MEISPPLLVSFLSFLKILLIFSHSDHINHVKNLIGVDHVGIGSDYDGVELVPEGLDDVSTYPALFDHLAEDGHGWVPWTADELKKLAGLPSSNINR